MRPDHRKDKIIKRVLPWVILLGFAGTIYWIYAPTKEQQTTPTTQEQHDTASDDDSLTSLQDEEQEEDDKQDDEGQQEASITDETVTPSPQTEFTPHFKKSLLSVKGDSLWQKISEKIPNSHLLAQLAPLRNSINKADKVDVLYSEYLQNPNDSNPENTAVLAVALQKEKKNHYLFAKIENGQARYYNRNGEAPFFTMDRYPFNYINISSEFNPHRKNPITHRIRPHLGVDFKGRYGDLVHSTGNGVVTIAGWEHGYGRVIYIEHPNGYQTRYAHLSKILVEPGQQVKRGQEIARLGNSGASTGSHLHYEVRINDTAYNPLSVKLPTANPIPKDELTSWKYYANSYVATIKQLQKAPKR